MKAKPVRAPSLVRSFLKPMLRRALPGAALARLGSLKRLKGGGLETTSAGFGVAAKLCALRRGVLVVCAASTLAACVSARAQAVVTDCSEGGLLNALASGTNVTFSGDCTITLTQPIDISGVTTIDGGNFAVKLSGGGAVTLFNVSGSLTLKNVTIAGGLGGLGGAVYISPGGSVLATNCMFSGNLALGTNGTPGVKGADSAHAVGGNGTDGTSGTPAMGGAIYNSGTLTLLNCTFVTNNATAGNGAVGGDGGGSGGSLGQGGNGGAGGSGAQALGGAVYNGSSLTAVNCTFTGNSVAGGNAAAGGAGGSALFPGRAGSGGAGGLGSGAGIYNASNIVVWACTFSGNTAAGGNSAAGGTKSNGAGASGPNGGDAQGAGLTSTFSGLMTNCTFFDNMVIGGNGGNGGPAVASAGQAGNGGNGGNGIGGSIYNASGTFTNVNSTIAAGAAVGGTNGVAGGGPFPGTDGQLGQALGGGLANQGTFRLANSLLSTNTPGGNGNGAFIDGGHNLSSDASISLGATSFTSTNPKLGPLTNNGGPTLTMALLTTNSLAWNAIPTNTATVPATDQRGVIRPQGGTNADIGAYELATSPNIITQPQSQSQSFGGSVTFTVDAAGATLRYQWQFGSSNIPTATASSYTLSNVNVTNGGGYRVVITNSYGSITSAVATLTIVPYILSAPTNQEVAVKGTASFSVSATGTAPLYYQWYFNSTNPVSTATNLTLSNAQITNAGSYTVVITNSGGSVTSAPATLLVDSILVQPESQTVEVGGTVYLSVVASGTSLQYQWYRDLTNLLQGVVQPQYQFPATTNSAGLYHVVVNNALVRMVSQTALVEVVGPNVPNILLAPTNQEVAVNGTANFSVSATGTSPLYYQWYFNSTYPVPGATATNLVLSNAQLTNAGSYTVVITNLGGSITSAPATLLVDAILVQPASQTVPAGSTVTFSVVASGTSLQYQWYQNITNLITGVIAPSYSFIATTNRAGLYNVRVYNSLVVMESLPALLKVVTPTAISQTSVTSNRFNLVFPTQPNLDYVLQSKNSLLDANWTPLQTNAGTGSWLTNSDWATNRPGRFYRLLIQ